MGNEKLQYIYDAKEFCEGPEAGESCSRPVKMGREREYFNQRNKELQEFIVQNNADLEVEKKKKVDTSGQLFGISNQNNNQRISLDEKFPADMLYKIATDNMSPYILPNTFVGIKFSDYRANGKICIYRYRGKTYCNLIKVKNNKIIAESFNEKYKPVLLDPNDFYLIAVVSTLHLTTNEIIAFLIQLKR
ncbi:MAG: S24 family peptidase [Bacteriovorax sp.]|nr:S24 family peptidase [Bacteriovorax sp.]